MGRIFILSPAKTAGRRAALLHNPGARFELACRLRGAQGVPLGELFSFLSGLYFRGKVTYARRFCEPPANIPGVYVITSNRGLLPIELPVTLAELKAFSDVPIDPEDARYAAPLARAARALAKAAGPECITVFLGSISTARYVEPLLEHFGNRLVFPPAFVGRGDMSRGGLLLRAVAAETELEYAALDGAVRKGRRPEKLAPRRWGFRVTEGETRIS